MTKEESVEPTLQPFEGVIKSINRISGTVVLFTESENDTAEERSIDKKIMDNMKIMAKNVSFLDRIFIVNHSTLLTPYNDAAKWFSLVADAYLGFITFANGEQWRDYTKGALYLGSAVAKLAEALNKFGKVAVTAGGTFKIGRGVIDILDERNECHEKVAGGITALSGICDIIAKLFPKSAIIATWFSCTFMIAAGYFNDGNWVGGFLTLGISTILSITMGKVLNALLKKVVTALMKTIMSALKLTASPLATNPFTVVAALAIIVLIGTLLAQSISNLTFAQGGFPVYNQPFIAREAGPELVGRMDGRSAVVSNDQIVEAVSLGVYNAFLSALSEGGTKVPATARVYLDGKQMTSSVERVQKERGLSIMGSGVNYGF